MKSQQALLSKKHTSKQLIMSGILAKVVPLLLGLTAATFIALRFGPQVLFNNDMVSYTRDIYLCFFCVFCGFVLIKRTRLPSKIATAANCKLGSSLTEHRLDQAVVFGGLSSCPFLLLVLRKFTLAYF